MNHILTDEQIIHLLKNINIMAEQQLQLDERLKRVEEQLKQTTGFTTPTDPQERVIE